MNLFSNVINKLNNTDSDILGGVNSTYDLLSLLETFNSPASSLDQKSLAVSAVIVDVISLTNNIMTV